MVSKLNRGSAFAAIGKTLWHGVSGNGPGLGARLGAFPRWVGGTFKGKYPGTTPGRMALLAGAVLYIVSPIDLVPELLLTVFGLADDVLIATWLTGAVLEETERYLKWERGSVGGTVPPNGPPPGKGATPPPRGPVPGEVIDGEVVGEARQRTA